ncbi:MAG: hypothetical protein IPJ71_17005 [Bdellovibrionales bacterium]|nr:hypothetical protein [Bdellovibrionales bacterium]
MRSANFTVIVLVEKFIRFPSAFLKLAQIARGWEEEKSAFCDQWGSAAFPEYSQEPLHRQIEETRARLQRRFNGEMFLVYFQAYTTTFSRTVHLREQFKTAFSFPDVKGVVVGTRPDCGFRCRSGFME